jgi:hypothetical protein
VNLGLPEILIILGVCLCVLVLVTTIIVVVVFLVKRKGKSTNISQQSPEDL